MLTLLETALSTQDALLAEMVKILEAMGVEGMNWTISLPEVNSAYAIATHATASQYWWIRENLHGETIDRDRPAEFTARAADLGALKAEMARVQAVTRAIFAGLGPEDLTAERVVRGKSVSVEWIVLHVIEHTAIHLGHLQLTQQLWEGRAD